jgi:hypothetical protein
VVGKTLYEVAGSKTFVAAEALDVVGGAGALEGVGVGGALASGGTRLGDSLAALLVPVLLLGQGHPAC